MTDSKTPKTPERITLKRSMETPSPLKEDSPMDEVSSTKSWTSSSSFDSESYLCASCKRKKFESRSETSSEEDEYDSNNISDVDSFSMSDTTYSSNGSGYISMDDSSSIDDTISCEDYSDTTSYYCDRSASSSSCSETDEFYSESTSGDDSNVISSSKEMNKNAQKRPNKYKIDDVRQDVHRDKEVNGTVDRARMSWILNLLLNQKTLQEIVKDIADGIFDFNEIEDIFPWKSVQDWRQFTPAKLQNEKNEFKNMTDERMKMLLTFMLNRKSRDELLKLITDNSLSLDNIQKSYLRNHMAEDEEGISGILANVSANAKTLLSKVTNNTEAKNSKKPKDVTTKKRNTAKKGEKDTDTKKKGSNLEKATKKVQVVKLKNEKRVGDINGGNKVGEASKEIALTEENPSPPANNEKASSDLTESLMQTRHEGFEESSLKSPQGDRAAYKLPVRCDTKKTAKSKSLADGDEKLASGKKLSEKIGKDVKPGMRNKGKKHEVGNIVSLWESNDYAKEMMEKPKTDESDEDSENARRSDMKAYNCCSEAETNEKFDESLQKSKTNQITNPFFITSGEQNVYYSNNENELDHVQEYNINISTIPIKTEQLDTDMLTKLNCEMVRIKEEPQSEYSSNEFDQPIDEKILNINKDVMEKVSSGKKIQTKRNKAKINTKNTRVSKAKSVAKPSKVAPATNNKNDKRAIKGTNERKATNTERKGSIDNKWNKMRKLDRIERKKIEKVRRHEKRMAKAMSQFSEEAIKLVKQMGYIKETDGYSSSCSSESSCSSSSGSSYSSSTESCSCSSCCDYSSSDEYSEYTLCSCSSCGSSCSCSDFEYDNEE